ncbi:MAG: FAD-dependent oxidoreductase [Elusimicrobiota bacterium]
MPHLGTLENPLRVAVIGSGPSGFYAAEALHRQKDFVARVDMFDRLPTPYGLVRGGVAPDHQKIKSVIAVYERIASNPNFRFFGNVHIGRDISAADLAARYHQIVYAVGCESDRKMGIPGEDLPGSHAATTFVGWYNGHPDYRDKIFDLSGESAAVVGVGNVAMDVIRILMKNPDDLKSTDIASYALKVLRASRIKTVYVLGRRGPAEATYSPQEIQDIGSLAGADLVIRDDEAAVEEASKPLLSDPQARKNAEYIAQKSKNGEGINRRKIRLRFCVSPVEILGKNGRANALKIEKTALTADGKGGTDARGTGRHEILEAGLILRAIGYRGIPIPGVPFNDKRGIIPNSGGRVTDGRDQTVPGQYAVGWIKRGPSGLIGTNRADSIATVEAMIADAKAGLVSASINNGRLEAMDDWIKERGLTPVGFPEWKILDRIEIERGAVLGKIREKFSSQEEMLAALGKMTCPR